MTRDIRELEALPVGTTIYFFWNGKERYLRKIRTSERYPLPWYSREYDHCVQSRDVPSGWQVMRF